jgi:transposase
VPNSIIPRGYATPSLLSQIITSKYQYGLPLYRQEAMFKQYVIELSRKTMSDWMMKCAELLKLLYDRLYELILEQRAIAADETTLKVVKEDKAKCYMWLYCTGTDTPENKLVDTNSPNIVFYDHNISHTGTCAVDYLQVYSGYLQVDGYVGYEQTQATRVGCWAHARRKFMEAKTAQGKKLSGKADWALNHIQKRYRIEMLIKAKTADEQQAIRQEKGLPLLEQLKQWLIKSE